MRMVAAGATLLLLAFSTAQAGEQARIPRPTDKLDPAPPPPAVGLSSMNLPVTISVDALSAAVAKAIPAEKREEQKWLDGAALVSRPGFEYQYMITRGAPELKASGDTFEITFPQMQFRVRGRLEPGGPVGGCGYREPLRKLVLKAKTKLAWAPDGTIESKTAFEPVELPEPCTLQPMGVEMTPVLEKLVAARLPAMARNIDAAIEAQSVSRRRLAALWQKLQQPIELRPGVWLALSPSGLAVAPLAAEGAKAIKTSLGLDLAPQAVKGEKPSAREAPVPRFAAGAPKGSGCHIAIPMQISYGQMNARLQKKVVGTNFDAGPLGSIKIVSTNLYGSGDRLVMEIGVSGGVNGKIYVIGKPALDALMIKIEDLDLTIETKNLLAKAANSMAKEKLIAALEPSARVDLKDPVEAWRRDLQDRLRREILPGVWMQPSDIKVSLRGVYPAPGGIEIQAVLDASLNLSAR
ncbi:MAG TPA: DUF4403 family protein [Thermoanaerobaculia bacterium]|nr:DUF4403 family protein [Thermoanaerobaculia bacterium]